MMWNQPRNTMQADGGRPMRQQPALLKPAPKPMAVPSAAVQPIAGDLQTQEVAGQMDQALSSTQREQQAKDMQAQMGNLQDAMASKNMAGAQADMAAKSAADSMASATTGGNMAIASDPPSYADEWSRLDREPAQIPDPVAQAVDIDGIMQNQLVATQPVRQAPINPQPRMGMKQRYKQYQDYQDGLYRDAFKQPDPVAPSPSDGDNFNEWVQKQNAMGQLFQ